MLFGNICNPWDDASPSDRQVIISSANGTASGRVCATPPGDLSARAAPTLATSRALELSTSPPIMTTKLLKDSTYNKNNPTN